MSFTLGKSGSRASSELVLPLEEPEEQQSIGEDLTQLRLSWLKDPRPDLLPNTIRWLRYFHRHPPSPLLLSSLETRVEVLRTWVSAPPWYATRSDFEAATSALEMWEPMLLAARRSSRKSSS